MVNIYTLSVIVVLIANTTFTVVSGGIISPSRFMNKFNYYSSSCRLKNWKTARIISLQISKNLLL